MTKRLFCSAIITVFIMPFVRAIPAFAAGDRVVTHVVDGDLNGIRYRTKLDLINLSPSLNTPITKVSILFFRENGTPWNITTNLGTGSTLTVPTLGYSQTIRIETPGTGSYASGYAIIRNLETNSSDFADNYEVGITAYYEVSRGNDVIDTVSIPIAQPTVFWISPVEINVSKGLNTGFAVVNLLETSNTVTLYLSEAVEPLSGSATDRGSTSFTLDNSANKKKVGFLNESQFFPNLGNFKGMVYGTAQGPVAILSLLQTQSTFGGVPNGVQFSTLVPAYLDTSRRNTYMFLPQGYSLDADLPVVDYFRNESSTPDTYYETPWDLLFETVGSAGTARRLTPQQGAAFSSLGVITNADQFDQISISDLRSRTYTYDSIDLGNTSANLKTNFTFAIRTGLGRYAKVRIYNVLEYSGLPERDLLLEIYVFK